jgi:hypothetical protein
LGTRPHIQEKKTLLERRKHLEWLGVDGRIILREIFKKLGVM